MLVGRGRELEGLDRMLDVAASGRGGLRVIYGAPGIGKTRLADEVAERATGRGFAVAWGRAWETGGAPAYWPWIEALGALGVDLPAPVAALLDRDAPVRRGDAAREDPASARFELFEATTSFLRAYARGRPLLLVFDDLHVADVASLELLWFVSRGLRAARVAVVATYRDAESRLAPVADVLGRIAQEGQTLALQPLSREEVAEVVRHDLGRFDGGLAGAVHDLTEGNPLFVHEALRTVAGASQLAPLTALQGAAAAGGVTALVRGRLAGTDDATRDLLEVASTLGREVPLPLLLEVSGAAPGEVQRRIDEIVARGLLERRTADRYVFSHVLVREAFYGLIPPDRRSSLHATIARTLERRVERGAEELLATLAHHAAAALPAGDPVHAIRLARRAAERARSQLAYEEAVALLERARSIGELAAVDDRERIEVQLALGWAATEAGQIAHGRDQFRQAAQLARALGDARQLARAALGQGGQYVLGETRGELVDVLREALAALDDAPDAEGCRLRARLLARLAAALTPSETPDEPLALARDAFRMLEGERDLQTRIDVAVGVGSAFADYAPASARLPVNEGLLADARAAGDRVLRLRALTRLACDHLERGDTASADAVINARSALADALGHPRYRWQTPLLRSMRAMPDGRFDDCEAEIAEADRLQAESRDPNAPMCIATHRLWMLVLAGRTEGLREQESRMLKALDARLPTAPFRWITALADARLGEPARAVKVLRALPTAPFSTHATARMSRVSIAEAALLCGARDIAETYCRAFPEDEDANACWGPFAFVCAAPIARVLGALAFAGGRPEDGARHCARALALSERMDAAAHRAWVELTWGEGLGGTAAAREHLERAGEAGERLAMPEVVARARAALAGTAGATREAAASRTATSAPPRSAGTAPPPPSFSLRRDATEWTVEHAGRAFRLKDLRGLGMLACLCERPGREVHSLDLVAGAAADAGAGAAVDLGDSGEVINARAREAYRQRLAELREELDDADRAADLGRAARLRYELDALTDQLSAAVGLGGRPRRVGAAAERARVTVQRRIREAIKKIAEQDAELGRHLDWTVRTGTFCAYEPEGRRPPS
jgi:hypothetical protein